MRVFPKRSSFLAAAAMLVGLASPASAAPILNVTPGTIADSPAQTVLTFEVDPNGTALSAMVLNLSALSSGLQIVSIQSLDGEVATSGPALNPPNYEASFSGLFFSGDRVASFTVGTVTVEGFTSGTPLVVSGNFTDSSFNDIPIGPTNVAVVAPEPASAALLALGILALASARRARA